jgi:pyrophosphate--fructose-6-phosphate 1-phosphotransferase
MRIERRKGKDKPVIKKARVELDGAPFKLFEANRQNWALNDCFRCPGPIQFSGTGSSFAANMTLALEINNGNPIYIR